MDFNNFKVAKQANSAVVESVEQEEKVGDVNSLFSSYKVASPQSKNGTFYPPDNTGTRIYQGCSGSCKTETGHWVIGNRVICTVCKHEYKI